MPTDAVRYPLDAGQVGHALQNNQIGRVVERGQVSSQQVFCKTSKACHAIRRSKRHVFARRQQVVGQLNGIGRFVAQGHRTEVNQFVGAVIQLYPFKFRKTHIGSGIRHDFGHHHVKQRRDIWQHHIDRGTRDAVSAAIFYAVGHTELVELSGLQGRGKGEGYLRQVVRINGRLPYPNAGCKGISSRIFGTGRVKGFRKLKQQFLRTICERLQQLRGCGVGRIVQRSIRGAGCTASQCGARLPVVGTFAHQIGVDALQRPASVPFERICVPGKGKSDAVYAGAVVFAFQYDVLGVVVERWHGNGQHRIGGKRGQRCGTRNRAEHRVSTRGHHIIGQGYGRTGRVAQGQAVGVDELGRSVVQLHPFHLRQAR